jgi:hypothetical protein
MSVTAPPPTGSTGSAGTTPPGTPTPFGEACPLCGAPLHPEQEWCLSCGAAARTRLAASPGWRGPIVTLVVVLVLSLGVLAGSLVKLAGGPATAATQTTTVTTAAAVTPTPSGPTTAQTTAAPTTTIPSTQPHVGATTTTTTPTSTAITTVPAVKPKANETVGGINLKHLKQSIAERLRKLRLKGQ